MVLPSVRLLQETILITNGTQHNTAALGFTVIILFSMLMACKVLLYVSGSLSTCEKTKSLTPD